MRLWVHALLQEEVDQIINDEMKDCTIIPSAWFDQLLKDANYVGHFSGRILNDYSLRIKEYKLEQDRKLLKELKQAWADKDNPDLSNLSSEGIEFIRIKIKELEEVA